MKNIKIKQIKTKILCLVLVPVLVFLAVVSSYSSASVVYAEEDDNIVELAARALWSVVGVFIPYDDVVDAALDCYELGDALGNHMIDNGDGTITFDATGVQQLIDAFEQWEKVQGFSVKDLAKFNSGLPYTYNFLIRGTGVYAGNGSSTEYCVFKGVSSSTSRRVAGAVYNSDGKICADVKYDYGDDDLKINYLAKSSYSYKVYVDGKTYSRTSTGYISKSFDYTAILMGDFPVFSSYESMANYLNTGEGYEDALNYNDLIYKIPKSSRYSNPYTGGDVTLSKKKVIELPDFVVNNIDPDDDPDENDKKINDWLFDDEDDESGSDEESTESPESESETESDNNPDPVPEPDDNDDGSSGGTIVDLTPLTDVLERIYDKLCEILADMKDGFDDVVSQLKALKRWTALDVMFNGVDAVADWLSFLQDLFNNVSAGVATLVSGFSEVGELMKTKFPFSIPWDMAFMLNFLADNPKAPVFELPLSLPSYGVSETIIIDFAQFEAISKVSRLLLTLIYTLGLMKLTSKIISTKKGS